MTVLQASLVKVENTSSPKTPLPPSKLVFGKTFTDHMLTVDWNSNTGWAEPKIGPCECSASALGGDVSVGDVG
jgi:branched-chain amino acid aminotransferase